MANCLKRLLGRCCPCDCGQGEGWREATVVAVRGRTAYTTDCTVTLRPGHHPQPGQRIVVTDGCTSVGSTPQHRPRPRPSDEDVFVPPAPDFDAWPRPVVLGRALSLPTSSGTPLVAGQLPSGAGTPLSRGETISHIRQQRIQRPEALPFQFTTPLQVDGAQEATVFPFTRTQRRLTTAFPTRRTASDQYTIWDDGEYGPNETLPRWRIKGMAGSVAGEYQGQETTRPLDVDDRTTPKVVPIAVPGSAPVLEVEPVIHYRVTRDGVQEDHWVVPEEMWMEWVSTYPPESDTAPGYPVAQRLVLAAAYPKPEGSTGRVEEIVGGYDFNGAVATTWDGNTTQGVPGVSVTVQGGYAFPLDSSGYPVSPRTDALPGAVVQRWAIQRLLWPGVRPPPLSGQGMPQFEAELPGLGVLLAGARANTASAGPHLDHPLSGDDPWLTLGGEPLSVTSWAVLARRGAERTEGGERTWPAELGLLTCDGITLTARWPGQGPQTVALTALLADLLGEGEEVTDALLESEYDRPGHPDNVRLVWGLRERPAPGDAVRADGAALLVAWEPWRDWTPEEWRGTKTRRPRTLDRWLATLWEQWPPPPLHGLTAVGRVTPPVLDGDGRPRYGREPLVEYATAPHGARWPWAVRKWLEQPDEREKVTAQPGQPVIPLHGPALYVGRVQGRFPLPEDAAWLGPDVTRWGLRMFASRSLPDLSQQRVQHLAVYYLRDNIIIT